MNPETPLAYSVAQASKLAGVGRSHLYEEIKAGRLPVRKAGRRTLVLASDLSAWLAELPAARSRGSNQPPSTNVTK